MIEYIRNWNIYVCITHWIHLLIYSSIGRFITSDSICGTVTCTTLVTHRVTHRWHVTRVTHGWHATPGLGWPPRCAGWLPVRCASRAQAGAVSVQGWVSKRTPPQLGIAPLRHTVGQCGRWSGRAVDTGRNETLSSAVISAQCLRETVSSLVQLSSLTQILWAVKYKPHWRFWQKLPLWYAGSHQSHKTS